MLTNHKLRPLYLGVTNDLERRIFEHKTGKTEGYTKKYNLKRLIYYEEFEYIRDAIRREKQLKNWHREWKLNLIEAVNHDFSDLAKDWYDDLDPETSSG
ncbi:GIY-YIG nuclease family protein [candidate division KSB1 bacterium]